MDPSTWSVRARNLPEHARNLIHTDEGARAAGFDAALVAGVTVYAYLTRPIVEAWGEGWLRRGGTHVEFRAPVQTDDRVDCVPAVVDGATEVRATVNGELRARCTAWSTAPETTGPLGPLDEPLERRQVQLTGDWDGYGQRSGDDLALYPESGIVHPAVWPALANGFVHDYLAVGSWVHTRSRIRHHDIARVGDVATVDATVVDRFDTRSGSRAVLDVRISIEGAPVAALEHEGFVGLHPSCPLPGPDDAGS